MLGFFRKKHIAKRIFWGLVLTIMPVFILWGTGAVSRIRYKGPAVIGTIMGDEVHFGEFRESLKGVRTFLILNYFYKPEMLEDLLKNKPLIAQLAWERLIVLRETENYKIRVSDKEVIEYIKRNPLFNQNNKFSDRIYEYILKYRMGIEPRTFEEFVRKNLESKKLYDLVTDDITVTDEEILNEYGRENERFKVSYITISPKELLDKVKIEEGELRDYYERHKAEFIAPAQEGTLKNRRDIRPAYFEDVKEAIRTFIAGQKARILASEEAREVHKKMNDLMEKEKKSFGETAKILGFKTRGTPFFLQSDYLNDIGEAYQLAREATKLKIGEISKPIDARNGTLIFVVLWTEPYSIKKFEKEKKEYSAKALQNKKQRFLDNWLRQLGLRARRDVDFGDIEKYL